GCAAGEAHPGSQAALGAPAHRALRGDARAARPAARARRHRSRERLPEIRSVARRRARLHAGDAVLGEADRPAGPQSVSPAHEPRLRLRHPALLSGHGERGLLPRARPLQRFAGSAAVSKPGAVGVARALEVRWADSMIGALIDRHPRLANWLYGFTPPEQGTVVLVHRRVYIVPT